MLKVSGTAPAVPGAPPGANRQRVATTACFSRTAPAARMARAVAEDSGAVMPVCAWVDGEYGISGVYLGVEAEIGAVGVRRIVQRDLTEAELAALRTAAEAVREKQAVVATL